MFFTMDEVALIDGLIATYFVADSVSESVRVRYYETHQHLQDNRTDYVDLRNIKEALFFWLRYFMGVSNLKRIFGQSLQRRRDY